jgi:hypothetical protein
LHSNSWTKRKSKFPSIPLLILPLLFSEFAIPELPSGQVLRFELLGPWDDPHLIGLNAIEMFTKTGLPPEVIKVR